MFSIPGLQLIYIWEGIFKIGNNEINLIQDFHNPKFILKNLVIFASLFFFYSLPFQLMRKLNYTKKSLIYFFVIFSALIIMNYLNIFEYLNSIKFGGGVFLKINNFLFNGNLIFFLTISSLGILTIYNYFILSKKNKILLICLIVFCFPKYILQEYFEPLILVILFTLIDLGTKNLKIFHQKKFYLYFVFILPPIILVVSIIDIFCSLLINNFRYWQGNYKFTFKSSFSKIIDQRPRNMPR